MHWLTKKTYNFLFPSIVEIPKAKKQTGRSRRKRAEAFLSNAFQTYRREIWLISAGYFVLRFLGLLLPVVLRFTLEPILSNEAIRFRGVEFSAAQAFALTMLVGIGVAALQATVLKQILGLAASVGHAFVAKIRQGAFEQILRVPANYLDRRGTGKVLLRFIGDSDALRIWASRIGPAWQADRLIILLIAILMLTLDVTLGAISLIFLPSFYLASRWFQPTLVKQTVHARQQQARFTGRVESRLQNIRYSKWLHAEDSLRREIEKECKAISDTNSRRDTVGASLEAISYLLAAFLIVSILVVGVIRVWNSTLDSGTLLAEVWLVFQMGEAIRRLGHAAVIAQKSKVSVQRLLSLLERNAESGRSSKLPRLKIEKRRLSLYTVSAETKASKSRKLLATFKGKGIHTLPHEVDSDAFLESVFRFSKKPKYEVEIDGNFASSLNVDSIRRNLGWLDLDLPIFEGTFEENVRLAGSYESNRFEQVRSFLNETNHVAETWLSNPVRLGKKSGVSSQDRVLIQICRVLLRRHKIIIASSRTWQCVDTKVQTYLASKSMVLIFTDQNSETRIA